MSNRVYKRKYVGVTCSVEGCEEPASVKYMCRVHYNKALYEKDPEHYKAQQRGYAKKKKSTVKPKQGGSAKIKRTRSQVKSVYSVADIQRLQPEKMPTVISLIFKDIAKYNTIKDKVKNQVYSENNRRITCRSSSTAQTSTTPFR